MLKQLYSFMLEHAFSHFKNTCIHIMSGFSLNALWKNSVRAYWSVHVGREVSLPLLVQPIKKNFIPIDFKLGTLIHIIDSYCHRCLWEPVAWYWLGWRESPLAHSVEHWSRKPKDPNSNHGGCSTIFHNCICICDNGAPTWIRCFFVWQNIPCQTCKSVTDPPISRTKFLVEGKYITGVCTNQLFDTDSAGGNPL